MQKAQKEDVLVEALDGGDCVALAQAYALDATAFPHASLPFLVRADLPLVWVARTCSERSAKGPVIGFIATRMVHEDEKLEISGLAVAEEWRGAGVGKRLVRAVLDAAAERRVRDVCLHVSTGNSAAARLYEREGFRRVMRLRAYYSSPSFTEGGDAWLMRARPVREHDNGR